LLGIANEFLEPALALSVLLMVQLMINTFEQYFNLNEILLYCSFSSDLLIFEVAQVLRAVIF
jgi:hypothetical protein